MKRRERHQLPTLAEEFLRTQPTRSSEQILRSFHRWLANKPVALSGLRPDEVENFFTQPFRKVVQPRTARTYRSRLIAYLKWLHERDYLAFDPRELGVRHRRPLPQLAVDFTRSLEPTLRPSTCRHYVTTLTHFHEWLQDARLSAKRITRPQMEQWLLSLHDEGLHAATRIHAIQHVRSYFRWLNERGELDHPADELVRRRDMPKLPQYLPRPLPPVIDSELQNRLRASLHPLWLGLLVMRETGLRIGELRTLEFDCVREDSNGNHFLKVPLGKLNNERLVPLAASTRQLLDRLRLLGKIPRVHLIERVQGGPVAYADYTVALRKAADGLTDSAPITSHRLRHTYATTLLNAGMSLPSVMKLLGHRDYRMTLRYTAVTQETVGREYFAALSELQTRYEGLRSGSAAEADPIKAVDDLITWLKNRVAHELGKENEARALTKRLTRLRVQLASYAR